MRKKLTMSRAVRIAGAGGGGLESPQSDRQKCERRFDRIHITFGMRDP
jgi:hypothetical protein